MCVISYVSQHPNKRTYLKNENITKIYYNDL